MLIFVAQMRFVSAVRGTVAGAVAYYVAVKEYSAACKFARGGVETLRIETNEQIGPNSVAIQGGHLNIEGSGEVYK